MNLDESAILNDNSVLMNDRTNRIDSSDEESERNEYIEEFNILLTEVA